MNDEDEEIEQEQEDVDPRCPHCDGTGEGMADGLSCSACNGRGY